jgi:hypothetical protein
VYLSSPRLGAQRRDSVTVGVILEALVVLEVILIFVAFLKLLKFSKRFSDTMRVII